VHTAAGQIRQGRAWR